jgi:hypothetical protein
MNEWQAIWNSRKMPEGEKISLMDRLIKADGYNIGTGLGEIGYD